MVYYKKEGQMNLSDRIAIETGISNKDSFKKIGKHSIDIHQRLHMRLKKIVHLFQVIIF